MKRAAKRKTATQVALENEQRRRDAIFNIPILDQMKGVLEAQRIYAEACGLPAPTTVKVPIKYVGYLDFTKGKAGP